MNSSPLTSAGSTPQFDPCEFYNLSQVLASGASEAELRTAVGRAHYAMYLIASARPIVIAHVDMTPPRQRGGSHQHLIKSLSEIQGQLATSQQLDRLRRLSNTFAKIAVFAQVGCFGLIPGFKQTAI